ncbi:MAG: transaldolase [Synergistaceae bacterium]|jgi:transaldolase|nr:transaldolase [Synergistaceae bacterium]
MNETILHKIAELGQSVWLDTINRELLMEGGLADWVSRGIRGVTTNPAIFEQAIAATTDYDGDVRSLAQEGQSTANIYETLTLREVRAAADILRTVYDRTGRRDGYVSLEVNPMLASDPKSTVSEAKRLFKALERPNVMIKIPATSEGVEAIEECIACGVNVNATLIFSGAQYAAVAEAFLKGLEKLAQKGEPLTPASVASVFVSRIDAVVDALLAKSPGEDEQALKGHIAVDNTRLIYQKYKTVFNPENPRWKKLADAGARSQRPLWASTGTKNPAYSDVLYVETLVGPDTVNTIPPKTLAALMEHGKALCLLEDDLTGATTRLQRLHALNIDLDAVCLKLLQDGVAAFNASFDTLMKSIEAKAKKQ